MRYRKISGGATDHAVSRLMKQYDFKGTRKDAKKLLNACRRATRKKAGRVTISGENLEKYGFTREKLERLGLKNGETYAEISGRDSQNVKDVEE